MVTKKEEKKKLEINRRKTRENEKIAKKEHPHSGGFLSSDGFLWTDTNSDLKLIEPQILVSVNFNYLEFSRQAERPPERRTVCLVNHGDHPIAFQIQITDNYSYFVDRRNGVIPPRQTSVNASIRMPNMAVVHVFHRPHNEYKPEDRDAFYNVPHKDKMFVLLAPQMCQTFSPEAIFHNERCYEKLRIMLRYSGIEQKPNDTRQKQLLLHGVSGWSTWKEGEKRKKKNTRQIAAFKNIEKTILMNASREAISATPRVTPRKFSPALSKQKTPSPHLKKEGGFIKMLRNLNPFNKDDSKKVVEEPPKKTGSNSPVSKTKRMVVQAQEQQSPNIMKKTVKSARTGSRLSRENVEQMSPNITKKTAKSTKTGSPGRKKLVRSGENTIEQVSPNIARKSRDHERRLVEPISPNFRKKETVGSLQEQHKKTHETPSPNILRNSVKTDEKAQNVNESIKKE